MQNFNITKNFTYNELTKTKHKDLLKLNREQGLLFTDKMRLIVNYILQPTRNRYGLPVIINSGFRSLKLHYYIYGLNNKIRKAMGLKPIAVPLQSQHLEAEAVDFYVKGYDLKKVFDWIQCTLIFGQVILYVDENFIHISLPTLKNNGQVMIFENGKYRRLK